MSESRAKLHRVLGFWALVAYGVGDILGAGIYALVGKIAGHAGPASWLAFGVALAVAGLTALSYAELGGRFPRSGGEAHFCQQAFHRPRLSLLVGWLVFCSGVVSLATVSRAFAGYFGALFPPGWPDLQGGTIFLFLLVLAGINFWGIRQSSLTNIVCTVVEFSGLLLVIGAGLLFLFGDESRAQAVPPPPPETWPRGLAILQAAALAFFAFIGFEDMVNVAEEVKEPERTLPRAILTSLVFAGAIYIVVAWVATAVVPSAELAESEAPLLEVVRRAAPSVPAPLFTLIAIFAVANTALLNFIMASRLLYGMAEEGLLPSSLARVHGRNRTPHVAIAAIFVVASALALSGGLELLAGTTSVLILLVFLAVNAALVFVRIQDGSKPSSGFRAPAVAPVVGGVTSLVLVGFLPISALLRAAALAAVGIGVVAVAGRRR